MYVAHPPGVPIDDIVKLAGKVQKLGLSAVPHIIARKLESRDQLDTALARSKSSASTARCAWPATSRRTKPAFDSSLEVLQTGLFGKYGFRDVGVAGHPEGSKAIGEERVEQALRGKAEFAKTAGFNVYFATQFGFDPDGVHRLGGRDDREGHHAADPRRHARARPRYASSRSSRCSAASARRCECSRRARRDGEPAEHAGARRDGHLYRAASGAHIPIRV